MVQRLAIIGFVIAVIIAVFAFVQQQQAVGQIRAAQTAQAVAEMEGGTAVALAGQASGAQAEAESERDAAVEEAEAAGTAAADAQSTAGAAVDQANLASTSQAAGAATAGAQLTEAVGTAVAENEANATAIAQAETDLATANAQIAADATQEAFYIDALATATAQVDLASFAAQSAEQDRAQALEDAHAAATQIAQLEQDLAAAQIQLEGQPPQPTQSTAPTLVPTPTPADATAVPEPTLNADGTTTFTTEDDLISFDHPGSWVVGETDTGFIAIVTSEDVLTREEPELQPGQMEASLYFALGSSITGNEDGATLEEVTEVLKANLTESADSVFEYGDITELTIGGLDATRMEGTVVGNDTIIVVLDLGSDVYAILLAIVAEGEVPTFEPQLVAMLESLRLNLD